MTASHPGTHHRHPAPDPLPQRLTAGLVIARCKGTAPQVWSPNGSHEFVLALNGLCLTDPGDSTTPGTQLAAANRTAAASQKCRDRNGSLP